MNPTYKENYWDSPKLKQEFIDFLIEIHGLDLSLWDRLGFWDNLYRPFSYFSDNKLVSNVCVFSMDMTVMEKPCRVAQVSAVGTRPEYRRRGLNLELTQKALTWARDNHDFFFLFADEEAFQVYKKCGFRRTDEYKASVSVKGQVARPGAVKLDIQQADHLELVHRMASDREPASNLLGVSNKRLFMFWCVYFLSDQIYYIPECDVLVLYKRDNGLVSVFDIVGKGMPAFAEIYPYICDERDEVVEFLFMVDKLDLESVEHTKIVENGTHLLGNFALENTRFVFPYTAHA